MRWTIAARISLIVAVSLLAVWVLALAALYRSMRDETERARPSPERVAAVVELMEQTDPARRALALQAVASPQFSPQLVAAGEPAAAPSGPPVPEAIRRDYAAALQGRAFRLDWRPVRPFARWPRLGGAIGEALEFRIALSGGETLVIDTRGSLVVARSGLPVGFGAGLLGTLVAVVALLVMQRETKPLARLAAAVDRMDFSGEPAPLPDARRNAPEVRALVAAFERLQARLFGLLRARMALIGGISHDVRTFAARLRLRVEQIAEEGERRRAVADIDDMIRLLDDALLSSRAGAGELAQEMVEIAALARAEVEDRRAAGAAVDLRCAAASERAIVLGDRLALRRILANLIDNALKYGRAAHVRLAPSGGRIEMAVEDEGPGIPEAQRELMLEPFCRLEGSRSRGTGGAGLGLAIVRALAEAHGGEVSIGRAAGGGARVAVSLPLFEA
jgi:signal transduction histidine kinase